VATEKDLREIAKATGVSLVKLQLAAGVTPDAPTTIEEAKELYWHAPHNSKAQKLAHDKWYEFSKEEIYKASNAEQAKRALKNAPPHSYNETWAFLRWVNLCKTLKEANEAYHSIPSSIGERKRLENDAVWKIVHFYKTEEELNALVNSCGGPIRNAALHKLDRLAAQKIEKVSTVEEAERICMKAEHDSEVQKAAAAKWSELSLHEIERATTVDEVWKALEKAPTFTETQAAGLRKWADLCSTIEQAKDAHKKTRDRDDLKPAVLQRWISLCTTVEEVQEVFDYVADWNDDNRDAALEKWDKLSLTEVEKATSIETAWEVYGHCPDEGESKKAAYDKWVEFWILKVKEVKTVEEIIKMVNEPDSKAPYAVRRAMYDVWNTLSLQEVEKAATVEEVQAAYEKTRGGSDESQKAALEKWMGFYGTVRKIRAVYKANINNWPIRDAAFKKWINLCSTTKEATAAYKAASGEDNQQLALLKIIELEQKS
jgi:hypothetical protein